MYPWLQESVARHELLGKPQLSSQEDKALA
jgi:hypothetical protein